MSKCKVVEASFITDNDNYLSQVSKEVSVISDRKVCEYLSTGCVLAQVRAWYKHEQDLPEAILQLFLSEYLCPTDPQ